VAFGQKLNLTATKINTPIRLDGQLDDAAWANITPVTQFTQSFPTFGSACPNKTEVRIAYDNQAVYVGAYLYEQRDKIRRQLTQRDNIDRKDTDVFSVGLDTYHDQQNAFVFQVTAAGVQADARFSQNSTSSDGDDNDGMDRTWDAVWESKVAIKADGWVIEMKIPFSAIRFAKKDLQEWGLQFQRFSRHSNETYTWNPQNPSENGTINQFGIWSNLRDIVPPLRLSFLPYLSGGVKTTPTGTGNITETLKSGGMDIKYGINESFTLDVTLIPDFAQVQSDNVFLNLTPFQVKFDDFRPFFTEGTELFNKAGLFYSRRIGAQPTGASAILDQFGADSNYRIQKNPGITLLYNASKFSGRTKKNLGIGILNAITRNMHAIVKHIGTGKDSIIQTEPMANYNILVLDQALANRSSIAFTNTNVIRQGNSRNANVAALDISLFNKSNTYNFKFSPRLSNIWGKNESYNGFASYASFSKISGAFQYEAGSRVESDRYDPNDLGFIDVNNRVNYYVEAKYSFFNPTKHYLNHSYYLRVDNYHLYKPFTWTDLRIEANASFLFKNFWDLNFFMEARPKWRNDYFEARKAGAVFKSTSYCFMGVGGSSDSRKKLYGSLFIGYAIAPLPKVYYQYFESELRYRFSPRLSASISNKLEIDIGNRGYGFVESSTPDIIMSSRDITNVNTILSAQYGFSSRMNLTFRMRHNWSYVDNRQFFHLQSDGYLKDIPFISGQNQNFNIFNIDMFYTWDFLWGSRLTFAWKNALGGIVDLDPYRYHSFRQNLGQMFTSPHSNEVSLKVVYFLDYLKLTRKKS
jgi:hypothetical protein